MGEGEGGCHLVEMSQNEDFLNKTKNDLKISFLSITIWRGLGPKILKVSITSTFFGNILMTEVNLFWEEKSFCGKVK